MEAFSMEFGDKVYNIKLSSLNPLHKDSNVSFRCVPNECGETDTMVELRNFSGTLLISNALNNSNGNASAFKENGNEKVPNPTVNIERLDDADEKMLNLQDGAESLRSEEFMEGLDDALQDEIQTSTLGLQTQPDPQANNNEGTSSESDDSFSSNSDSEESTIHPKESNLTQIKPFIGMRVDVCDKDHIWCQSTITKIRRSAIHIHYDGWGNDWNEVLSYPSRRLAQIFTYTKEVKCLATIIPKKSTTKGWHECIWPCKAQILMPNPGSKRACDSLRQQINVFVVPYRTRDLPKKVQRKIKHGGMWIHVSYFINMPSNVL